MHDNPTTTSNSNNNRDKKCISKTFALLFENQDSGVLDLSDDVLQELKLKYLEASPTYDDLLLRGPVNEVHDIIFDDINEELIEKVAIEQQM